MTFDLGFSAQSITAGALVWVAIGYLAVRAWSSLRGERATGCGSSCKGCTASPAPVAIIPLEQLQAKG